jgi:hypothetical protein
MSPGASERAWRSHCIFEGWAHFTQGAAELKAAFSGNGIRDRLLMLERGQRTDM